MVTALHFVDREGFVIERILGLEHVTDTISLLLSHFFLDIGSVCQTCVDKNMIKLVICKENSTVSKV